MKAVNVFKGVVDVAIGLSWTIGTLVRGFDMGREGYFPDLQTSIGREIVNEAEKAARAARETSAPTAASAKSIVGFC